MAFIDFHPVILHFPIVLLWTALIFDLLKAYPAGHWLVISAALLAIPTVITGELAADHRPPCSFVEIHEALGITTLSFSLCHAAFRYFVLLKKKKIPHFIFVGLCLVNVILVTVTAEFGGAVAFGKGIFLEHKD